MNEKVKAQIICFSADLRWEGRSWEAITSQTQYHWQPRQHVAGPDTWYAGPWCCHCGQGPLCFLPQTHRWKGRRRRETERESTSPVVFSPTGLEVCYEQPMVCHISALWRVWFASDRRKGFLLLQIGHLMSATYCWGSCPLNPKWSCGALSNVGLVD